MGKHHEYGSNFYNITLKKQFKIEIISFFGRLFSKKKIKTNLKYLQLGCGLYDIDEKFINCDFYVPDLFNPFKKKKLYFLDLRYQLPFDDNKFEGIFSEHTIEHLYPSECNYLFKEILRVLKSGGIFRVIVPDLKKYINFYITKKKFLDREFKTGCEAIWNISSNFGHKNIWDAEWLIYQLKKSGFSSVEEKFYKNGENKDLLIDKNGREIESIYIEAKK